MADLIITLKGIKFNVCFYSNDVLRKECDKMERGNAKIVIVVLVILIILAGGFLGYKIVEKNGKNIETANEQSSDNDVLVTGLSKKEEKQVQIYKGNDRPIAVMIDNHNQAWPQVGLQKAYMVYEAIAEGGETRLMALFKGVDVEQIGPVRSARHYFLDYAMENDAIYVHFGWSPQAKSDIKKYFINNINGIEEDGTTFWRTKKKSAPHNALTSTEKILKSAENKKYRTTSTKESVLNYVTDEVNLEDGQSAISITIPHSKLQIVTYEYDAKNKVYNRIARKKAQTDWTTGENLTTKNIIVTMCDNSNLNDGENKGRQTLQNIGTFDGYYLTNGKAIKIKCIKNARDEQTVYKDLHGNEIKVNDGNTWVNICPTDAKIVIEGETEAGV